MEDGITLDTRYSMKKHIKDGISTEELDILSKRPEIVRIHEEMNHIFSKRNDPGRGFQTDLGVINSPFDEDLHRAIIGTIEDIRSYGIHVNDIILAGIGGSELGATAAITACGRKDIRYHPLTSLNNDTMTQVLDTIEAEHSILIIVSRSGTTKETLTAYSVIRSYLKEQLGDDWKHHCVAILGNDKQELAKELGSHTKIRIEPAMSGRFTGLHAANLFTMALAGVDTTSLCQGAQDMITTCLSHVDPAENQGLHIALLKYLMNISREKILWTTNVFSADLVNYGHWLDQLTEESLGHRTDISICTKTTELSNKLHSDFQNWLEGNNIFYHQFVFPLHSNDPPLPNPQQEGETLEMIEKAAYLGTVQSLAQAGRPSYSTYLPKINAYAIGQLMMRDMLSTIYLGELYGLDTPPEGTNGKGYFNQPGVQAYKHIMNELLSDPTKIDTGFLRE